MWWLWLCCVAVSVSVVPLSVPMSVSVALAEEGIMGICRSLYNPLVAAKAESRSDLKMENTLPVATIWCRACSIKTIKRQTKKEVRWMCRTADGSDQNAKNKRYRRKNGTTV